MSSDRKDYLDVLEVLSAIALPRASRNRLNKIRVRTEDHRLKTLLEAAIRQLDETPRMSLSVPSEQHRENIALAKYCQRIVADEIPTWQVLARRHGWQPPT